MVKTKSIRDLVEESDGTRVLVTRYWPRPFNRERLRISEWRRNVAPSKELLRHWRDGRISWPEYEKHYLQEMALESADISRLAQMVSCGAITLLCFEPEVEPHCHRCLLKQQVEQRMQATPE